jgi:uncharacterized protein (UPF0332 family)
LEKKYLIELGISEEFLKVAKKNLNVSLRTSANRLYFSFEKMIISYLLFKKIIVPKNHQKVWELCLEHLGEEFYSHIRELYDLRMQADYGNISKFVEFNKKILDNRIKESEKMIKKIRGKILGKKLKGGKFKYK